MILDRISIPETQDSGSLRDLRRSDCRRHFWPTHRMTSYEDRRSLYARSAELIRGPGSPGRADYHASNSIPTTAAGKSLGIATKTSYSDVEIWFRRSRRKWLKRSEVKEASFRFLAGRVRWNSASQTHRTHWPDFPLQTRKR